MSTTPPEPPQAPPPQPGYGGLGRTPTSGAILPVPGNAEIAVWFLVEIVLAIVAAVSDGFDARHLSPAFTMLCRCTSSTTTL